MACKLDIRDGASCAAAVAAASRSGRLDVVINTAGVFRTAPALELEEDDWTTSIETNLSGAFRLSCAAARRMIGQGRGRIITLASVSCRVVNPSYAAYATSKAGVAHFLLNYRRVRSTVEY